MDEVRIRTSETADLDALVALHLRAFPEEGPAIVTLVRDLLVDPTAQPLLSLVADRKGEVVGHVMFTAGHIEGEGGTVSILAPLAVAPSLQRQGLGSRLVQEGLSHLKQQGVDWVFVLGDPAYYSRFGFEDTEPLGLMAPYDLPPEYAGAWRVLGMQEGGGPPPSGTVSCCAALDQAHYWG